jgi:myo-inositol-1(or 4)-monophosphatase
MTENERAGNEPEQLLEVAREAAAIAGDLLLEHYRRPRRGVEAKSTPTDLVSEADLAAERAIRDLLAKRRPDDGVLGEEGGDEQGSSGLRWVVDPLDGTVNFLFRIPQWAVSIACEDAEGGIVGVVRDPIRSQEFTVVRGGPPMLDGQPVQPSDRDELATAMIATGFAYDADTRAKQGEIVARLLPKVRDIRRLGSAALDIAWTASGLYDAYYEFGVQPWDSAAGIPMCRAAGLEVHHLPARDGLRQGLLIAPPSIAGELRAIVMPD